MNNEAAEQTLNEVDSFCRSRKLSRADFARKLGIPYETFRKWFQKGKGKKKPSSRYLEKIRRFLRTETDAETHFRLLWNRILDWWKTQHHYSTLNELAGEIGWDAQSLGRYLRSQERPPRLVVEKIAKTIGVEIPRSDFSSEEALRKTDKVKYLLLFLEEELRWFRDASQGAREIFRKQLDPDDIGYISSLLTMLEDEDKFKRWLALTTNRFSFFKKGRVR